MILASSYTSPVWPAKFRFLVRAFVAFIMCGASCLWALSPLPPDNRTWDEALGSFQSEPTDNDYYGGEREGLRLHKLSPEKAEHLLMGALGDKQPTHIRLRAINAVGAIKMARAVESLVEIAENPAEPLAIRRAALSQGLRYIPGPRSRETALRVVEKKDIDLLFSAMWVLSADKTPPSIEGLRRCFEFVPRDSQSNLIHALSCSEDSGASLFIFGKLGPISETDSEHLQDAYLVLMAQQPIPEAEPVIRRYLYSKSALQRLYAFRFFRSFPNEYVAAAMLSELEAGRDSAIRDLGGEELTEMIDRFLAAELVSKDTKAKLEKYRRPAPKFSPENVFF